jgi:hypothetical protein
MRRFLQFLFAKQVRTTPALEAERRAQERRDLIDVQRRLDEIQETMEIIDRRKQARHAEQ